MAIEFLPTDPAEIVQGYDATATRVVHAIKGVTISQFAQMAGVDPKILLQKAERAALETVMRQEPDSVVRARLEARWLEIDRQLRPEAYAPISAKLAVTQLSPLQQAIAEVCLAETNPRVEVPMDDLS